MKTEDLSCLHRFESDGRHLFVHPDRPVWVVTNEVGRRIVALSDGRRSMDAVSRRLARDYGRAPGDLARDVSVFYDQLAGAGLLPLSRPEPVAPPPFESLFLHLNESCNLRCRHCYVESDARGRGLLPLRTVKGLLAELQELGGTSVTLSGGEPFLRRDLKGILGFAHDRLKEVRFLTNGTLLDRAWAGWLAARPRILLQISLDGPTPEVHDRNRGAGSFEKTLRGIETLREAGILDRLTLCMTLLKDTIAHAPDMIRLASELGVSMLRFLPLERTGRGGAGWQGLAPSRAAYERFYRYFYTDLPGQGLPLRLSSGLSGMYLFGAAEADGPHWCPLGRKLTISAQGDVFPCATLMFDEFRLGNIRDLSLARILGSEAFSRTVDACLSRKDRIASCRKCAWHGVCQGGCSGLVRSTRGRLLATDGLCTLRRGLLRELVFSTAGERERLASREGLGEVPDAR